MKPDVLNSPSGDRLTADSIKPSAPSRLMAFEMETGGHHASYIRNFAMQWSVHLVPHEIHFVVTPNFMHRHRDVVELIGDLSTDAVQIHAIQDDESKQLTGRTTRPFNSWKLFCKYADAFNADRGLLMYSDHFQLPMLIGQASPCPVSCIYFRPTFHYRTLKNYRPTLKQRLVAWRKKVLTQRLLKLKQLDVLLSLDPIAVDFMKTHFKTDAKILRLPDSFVRYETTDEQISQLKNELNIEPARKVCMLLGVLDTRKGPLQLLDAVTRLTPQVQSKLCLLLVGSLTESIATDVIEKVEQLNQNSPAQIILQNQYISDSVVQRYYDLADVALTTYQRHMGMSSALIRAALAKIPVLSSDFGLMGELVREQNLGITVNTEDPVDFSRGLTAVVNKPADELFDVDRALEFSASHSPDALAETLKELIGYCSENSTASTKTFKDGNPLRG